jgi:hypothetical protein
LISSSFSVRSVRVITISVVGNSGANKWGPSDRNDDWTL